MIDTLERLAYATGAGEDLRAVRTADTSAFDNLALVYNQDVHKNNGKAFPTTPGHFEDISCAADPVVTP